VWWQSRYEQTPGQASHAPKECPDALAREPGHGLVVMALHPRCPCSRASLSELEVLASSPHSPPIDIVVLTCTNNDGPDWTNSANCIRAKAIPGAKLIVDTGGRIASSLGMKTSGHVVAYDDAGRLVLTGGITPSRGQIGPNVGLRMLSQLGKLQTQDGRPTSEPTPLVTPVYGCELVSAESCDAACEEERP